MTWQTIASGAFVIIVALTALAFSLVALARLASVLDWVQRWEKTERMTPSDRAELLELRDATMKANATLKRINARLAQQNNAAAGIGQREPTDPAALKQYLRQKAGLTTAPRAKSDA